MKLRLSLLLGALWMAFATQGFADFYEENCVGPNNKCDDPDIFKECENKGSGKNLGHCLIKKQKADESSLVGRGKKLVGDAVGFATKAAGKIFCKTSCGSTKCEKMSRGRDCKKACGKDLPKACKDILDKRDAQMEAAKKELEQQQSEEKPEPVVIADPPPSVEEEEEEEE